MAKVIGIMGESGSGKTTSMQNLDPKTTFYIDADKKGLSWKGWREQYSKENMNYLKTDDARLILNVLKQIDKGIMKLKDGSSKDMKHIKTIVVDTLNGIMVADEMRRCKEKGYDKWQDLAQSVWEIVDIPLDFRDDLTVIFIAHSQTDRDDSGEIMTRIKTNGNKLGKILLESKMTTVLWAMQINGNYIFKTRADKSTCKTPKGAFDVDEIENDIKKVLDALKDY